MSTIEHLSLWDSPESNPHLRTRVGHAVGSSSHRVAEAPKVARKRRATMARKRAEGAGTITELPSGTLRTLRYERSPRPPKPPATQRKTRRCWLEEKLKRLQPLDLLARRLSVGGVALSCDAPLQSLPLVLVSRLPSVSSWRDLAQPNPPHPSDRICLLPPTHDLPLMGSLPVASCSS